ncbi:MAG: hypothetical protein HYY06_24445 [Deltaproteobacteria bacterium]|nr:hypothetical protein [Deltaproteobacteria bacterium]
MRTLAAILALSGCAEPPTAILVRLEVDEAIRDEVDELSLEVESGGESVFMLARELSGGAETISIRPGALASDAVLVLSASATLEGSSITTRATTRFTSGEDRDVCLFIDGRCDGLDCGSDDCRAGGCEPVVEAPSACAVPRCGESSTCDDRLDETIDACGADGACAHDPDPDVDGDGFDARSAGGDDCDDGDADAHPGAEDPCDQKDQNCDDLIDAEVLARLETDYAAMVRVLVTDTTAILTWIEVDALGLSRVVLARLGEDGIEVVEDLDAALWPALAPYGDGAVLTYRDLTSDGYELARLGAGGDLVESYDVEFGRLPPCAEDLFVERPMIAVAGTLVAVAYHGCEEDPRSSQPRLAVVDLDEGRLGLVADYSLDDGPVAFPSLAAVPGGFVAAWGRVGILTGAMIGPGGALVDTAQFGTQTAAFPALLPTGAGLGAVFLDVRVATDPELLAADLRLLGVPRPMAVEGADDDRPRSLVFSGTQSRTGAAALVYSPVCEPGDYHSLTPELVRVAGFQPAVVKVGALLGADLASGTGDVTYGPDGDLYYADVIGAPCTRESEVVLARMSCGAL